MNARSLRVLGPKTALVLGAAFFLAWTLPRARSAPTAAVIATTERVSVDSTGVQATDGDSSGPSISEDGNLVAIVSAAKLEASDLNGVADVYIHNRTSGTTARVSIDSSSGDADGRSSAPAISGNGRYVAFVSYASDLVTGDTNRVRDVFVRDLQTGTTERVSVSDTEGEANAGCFAPSISSDGRYVAFQSFASNLVGPTAPSSADVQHVFVRDRGVGTTELVSRMTDNLNIPGAPGDGDSGSPSISAGGRYVAFASAAKNLDLDGVPGAASNQCWDVFVRDRDQNETILVSVDTLGALADGHSTSPSISATAGSLIVAFESNATDLVSGDMLRKDDVFYRDILAANPTTVRVSASGSTEGNGHSLHPAISADGVHIAFYSYADNFGSDGNPFQDVFLYTVSGPTAGTLQRVSVDSSGADADGVNLWPAISSGNPYVAWPSAATDLVSGDTNSLTDVFVRGPF